MNLDELIFLQHKPKNQIKELFFSVGLNNLATSMIMLFEPVFLYQLGLGFSKIMLYYAVLYTVYFLILPLGGKVATRFGFEHAILFANPIFVVYLLLLFGATSNVNLVWIAAAVFAINKTLYWPSYHANFARYSDSENRGKEMSVMNVLSMLLVVLGPILGALIVKFFSFKILFSLCSILVLLSAWPMLRTKEEFKPTSFSYKEIFSRLRRKFFSKGYMSYLGFGEELVTLSLWPLFIFIAFKDSFMALGYVSAITVAISIVAAIYVGRLVDRKKDVNIKNTLGIIYAVSWVFRALSKAPVTVFLADLYNKVTKTSFYLPYFSMIYRKANRKGNLKYVMLMEVALALGKALMAWALVALFLFTNSLYIGFALAGVVSLLYLVL